MVGKNKPIPVITHTEILCYAIRHLEYWTNDVRAKVSSKPGAEEMLQAMMSRELQHLEALKMLYQLETGTEYEQEA